MITRWGHGHGLGHGWDDVVDVGVGVGPRIGGCGWVERVCEDRWIGFCDARMGICGVCFGFNRVNRIGF